MDNLEKVVAELKHLDGDELNKVWASPWACWQAGLLIRPHEKRAGNRPGGRGCRA